MSKPFSLPFHIAFFVWAIFSLSLISDIPVRYLPVLEILTYVLLGNTIMEIKGMYFQYWLVLFSAWASSNLMGLMISDSFKTVVTIYILIPFLYCVPSLHRFFVRT